MNNPWGQPQHAQLWQLQFQSFQSQCPPANQFCAPPGPANPFDISGSNWNQCQFWGWTSSNNFGPSPNFQNPYFHPVQGAPIPVSASASITSFENLTSSNAHLLTNANPTLQKPPQSEVIGSNPPTLNSTESQSFGNSASKVNNSPFRELAPCEVTNKNRCFIRVEYLRDEAINALLSCNRECFLKNGSVHFPRRLHSDVRKLLNSLNPPILVPFLSNNSKPGPIGTTQPFDTPQPQGNVKHVYGKKNRRKIARAARAFQVQPDSNPAQDSSRQVNVACKNMDAQNYGIKSEDLPLEGRNLLEWTGFCSYTVRGRYWLFDKDKYSEVSSLLNTLKPPVILSPEEPYKKTLSHKQKVDEFRKEESALMSYTRERIQKLRRDTSRYNKSNIYSPPPLLKMASAIERTDLSNAPARGTLNIPKSRPVPSPSSSLPKSKPQQPLKPSTSLSMKQIAEASRRKPFGIPGYEIIKHLESPSTISRTSGKFYKKFRVVLPTADETRFYAARNAKKIILRLVQSNVTGSFQEVGDSMKIEDIRFNGSSQKFLRTKAGHFNIDVTRRLKGGMPTLVEISAKIEGSATDDVVVYCISIVRMLNANEMLKDLKAKSPIPISYTRKLVTNSLNEAAENGILSADSTLLVSVKCPLGKNQMINPCRGVNCDHFACFDAFNFLQTYEKAKTSNWICPVCDSHLDYEDLRLDSFFDVIVSSLGDDSKHFNVNIDASGNFTIASTHAIDPEGCAPETIALVDDEDTIYILSSDDDSAAVCVHPGNKRTVDTSLAIDLSSDEEFDCRPVEEIFSERPISVEQGRPKRNAIEDKNGRPCKYEEEERHIKREPI